MVFAQRCDQRRPFNGVVDAGGIDDHRFIFEERPGVFHSFFQGIDKRRRVGFVQNNPNGVKGGAFEIQCLRSFTLRRVLAHFFWAQESLSVAVRLMIGRSGVDSSRSAVK